MLANVWSDVLAVLRDHSLILGPASATQTTAVVDAMLEAAVGVDHFDMTHPLFLWMQRLNAVRALYAPTLARGNTTFVRADAGSPVIVFVRGGGADAALVLCALPELSMNASAWATYTVPSPWSQGDMVMDVLADDK